jgi:hypothetical protein
MEGTFHLCLMGVGWNVELTNLRMNRYSLEKTIPHSTTWEKLVVS